MLQASYQHKHKEWSYIFQPVINRNKEVTGISGNVVDVCKLDDFLVAMFHS